jgi:hypothetical protein
MQKLPVQHPSLPVRPLPFDPRMVLVSHGRAILNSVSDYLYFEAQKVETVELRDSFSFALAILSQIREGNPEPVQAAQFKAFGCFLEVHRQRRSDIKWQWHKGIQSWSKDESNTTQKPDRAGDLAAADRHANVSIAVGEEDRNIQDGGVRDGALRAAAGR